MKDINKLIADESNNNSDVDHKSEPSLTDNNEKPDLKISEMLQDEEVKQSLNY